MKFKIDHLADIRRAALLSVAASALLAVPAYAQNASDDDQSAQAEDDEEDDDIVVTGSRIHRDTFTSTSPLQVIDSESIRDAGLVDTAEILKSTPVVQGAQLDVNVTSTGFVTSAGPGSSNVSLRALPASNTLVMINGRRLAPSGVEGAPSSPNLNLIPTSIIQRLDVLLDGASSVYGSDAIAGVVNVITRKNYEGLTIDAFASLPEDSGGEQERYSVLMGDAGERGSFTFALEYFHQGELKQNERDWTYGVDDNGNRQSCSFDFEIGGSPEKRCSGRIGNMIFDLAGGTRAVPTSLAPAGSTAIAGVPGFLNIRNAPNGTRDPLTRDDYLVAQRDIIGREERFNTFFTGEFDVGNALPGSSVFVESSLARAEALFHREPGQFFPTIPGTNPLNPFGRNVTPVWFLPNHRGGADVEIWQTRNYLGLQGDLGFLNAPSWDYETFVGYTRSTGFSNRRILLEDRLNLAINTTRLDASGNLVCGLPPGPDSFGFLSVAPCVPVNFFAPSLYTPGINDFATQAESDYLRGSRTVNTVVDQVTAGGFVTGPVYTLPAGDLKAVIGVEWREDGLKSDSDTIAATGGAAGTFDEISTEGSASLFEIYGELDIPVFSGQPFAERFDINLAGRFVDHELYGTNGVYSAKAAWSPMDWFTIRGTYGTSFRAPNLRELFLGGQSGFSSGLNDPCVVPLAAQGTDAQGNPVYLPGQDGRNAQILANCAAAGVNPTSLGLVAGVPGISSFRRGNPGLEPETSRTFTAGFVFEQPWTDLFDLRLGATYFDYQVNDVVSAPSLQQILLRCFGSSNFPNDAFCSRIAPRDGNGFLVSVDRTSFNIDEQGTTGFDFNVTGSKDFRAFGRDWTFTGDIAATKTESIFFVQESINAALVKSVTSFEFVEGFGSPEWRGTGNFRLMSGDWTAFWRTRWIGSQGPLANLGGATTRVENGGIPVTTVDDYFVHDASIGYVNDTWGVRVGVNNVFNEDPPLLDQDAAQATLSGHNAPLGAGYDLIGRRFFMNVTRSF
jgi:iron complex outermembrane receptor protein